MRRSRVSGGRRSAVVVINAAEDISLDLSPDEARTLARRLVAAADETAIGEQL